MYALDMNTYLPSTPSDPSAWQQALDAFLAEKHRRSGSYRTPDAYSRILAQFFGVSGADPARVTGRDVFAFAHSVGPSGREPCSITICARIAAISSFYRFLIRMGLAASNPCDALERPKVIAAPPRGLSAEQVRRVLDVIPNDIAGRRDRTIVLTLVLTARRKSEVLNLRAGDITFDGERAFYTYRAKGAKTGRRELPGPAYQAIVRTLQDLGKTLETMRPEESLWQAGAGPDGVVPSTFYSRFKRYLVAAGLPPSGIHVLRHTAAKLRRDVGESVESVSAFLDHSSLAVTTTYLRRLEGQHDASWGKVAEAIGLGR